MKLSLRETMGALNEQALHQAHRLVAEGVPAEQAIAELRQTVAMPAFRGNLLAVRQTDEQKIRTADVPTDLEPARRLLLDAIRAELRDLSPRYREQLANSHK